MSKRSGKEYSSRTSSIAYLCRVSVVERPTSFQMLISSTHRGVSGFTDRSTAVEAVEGGQGFVVRRFTLAPVSRLERLSDSYSITHLIIS